MTCLNSRVFWNMMIFEVNLIFTRVLSLYESTPAFEHAFCHFCHPLPLFLVHAMVFWKMDYASLIKIDVKLAHTFVACWQHLDMTWPQQDPTKGANNAKTSQDTIAIKMEAMVERLFHSYLTYATTWALTLGFSLIAKPWHFQIFL